MPQEQAAYLAGFDNNDPADRKNLEAWVTWLRHFGVFFSSPLDLDYSMLCSFPTFYKAPEAGRRGPTTGDARAAVLGDGGITTLYDGSHDENLRWYRYLFLGRGKPSTHVRVLASLNTKALKSGMPDELRALLSHVTAALPRTTAQEEA